MDINDIFDKYSLDDIVNALTRYEVTRACTEEYVRRMQEETHKTADNHGCYWSVNDDLFIQENPNMSNLELAKALGRTYRAVGERARILRKALKVAA